MKINQETWDFYQKLLGYNDAEIKKFRENPRNADVICKAPELMKRTIVVEVVDSHGCASQHKPGDKFYFDGSGNLLTKLCPKRVCIAALIPVGALIQAATELVYAGIDPNDMRFKRVGCSDVGIECGGWGHIVMELRVEERRR